MSHDCDRLLLNSIEQQSEECPDESTQLLHTITRISSFSGEPDDCSKALLFDPRGGRDVDEFHSQGALAEHQRGCSKPEHSLLLGTNLLLHVKK